MYEAFCVFLCVLAVFGGYVALKAAARALLRRACHRAEPCAACRECVGCPEKRTAGAATPPEAKSDGEKD